MEAPMFGRRSVVAIAAAVSVQAAPATWACTNAANLISNCGFDTSLMNWATFGGEGLLSFQPGDGSGPPVGGTGPGSAEVQATAIGGGQFAATVWQCISNPPPGNYGWGV